MPLTRLSARLLLVATIAAQFGVKKAMSQATATQGQSSPSASLEGDTNHPAEAQDWVETELYFGLGPADAPSVGVSEGQWRHFLDKEVSPRFPSGLSVISIYGQWQNKLPGANLCARPPASGLAS